MLFFKKRKEPLLSESDNHELREIERKTYLEEAKKLIKIKAEENAKKDYGIKQKKEEF